MPHSLRSSLLGTLLSALLLVPAAAPAGAALVDDENSNDLISTASVQVLNTGALQTQTGKLDGTFGDDDFVGIGLLRKMDRLMVVTMPADDFRGQPSFASRCDPDDVTFDDPTDCFEVPDTVLQIYPAGTLDAEVNDACSITEDVPEDPMVPNMPLTPCLASGDDSPNSDLVLTVDTGSLIRFQSPQTDTYFARIYTFSAMDNGDYVLSITLDPHIQCGDGIDNDADGDTDGADAGCNDGDDPSEEDSCLDGLDNDADGVVDNEPCDIPGCGLGPELAGILSLLLWLQERRGASRRGAAA